MSLGFLIMHARCYPSKARVADMNTTTADEPHIKQNRVFAPTDHFLLREIGPSKAAILCPIMMMTMSLIIVS